jgi:hypothetical protein
LRGYQTISGSPYSDYATGWMTRIRFLAGKRDFLYSIACRTTLGEWVLGPVFPGVTQQWREADHSPPSSAEVKNVVAIPPRPIRLYGVVLSESKSKDKCNFYLYQNTS